MTHVTAAIIREGGKILICKRGEGGNCANLWEFPGGKLEKGETLEECLVRECKEELDIDIAVKGLYTEITYNYPEREIILTFFDAFIAGGRINAKVHTDTRWVTPGELGSFSFCPADEEVAERLGRRA